MPLTPELARIFRITHVDNVAWDLEHGLQCRNSRIANPGFRNIGNLELIEKRKDRTVPVSPGGTLADYIPFYFTPRSPMLYNIKTGFHGIAKVPMAEIVIYEASAHALAANGVTVLFTDRHAKLALAEFSADLADLNRVDWNILQRSDFTHDPADPEKMGRYQAEALIHRELPCRHLSAVVCNGQAAKARVQAAAEQCGIPVPVVIQPGMFF